MMNLINQDILKEVESKKDFDNGVEVYEVDYE